MGLVAIDSLFVITISFSIGHSRAVAISKVWMACGIQISAGIEVTGFLLFAIEQAHKNCYGRISGEGSVKSAF